MGNLRQAAQQALDVLVAQDENGRPMRIHERETIDALRAALAQQERAEPSRSQKLADAGFTRRPGLWAMQARAALELIAAPMRPDGSWNRDREACRQIAAEALGRYDDE
jgi:hypothetical protein